MKIASAADVKSHFSAYLKESELAPMVVTRKGKAAAVLLGVQDEDELSGWFSLLTAGSGDYERRPAALPGWPGDRA